MKIELVINLKTAKTLQSHLRSRYSERADEVIEMMEIYLLRCVSCFVGASRNSGQCGTSVAFGAKRRSAAQGTCEGSARRLETVHLAAASYG